jgi:hypothetical protein
MVMYSHFVILEMLRPPLPSFPLPLPHVVVAMALVSIDRTVIVPVIIAVR